MARKTLQVLWAEHGVLRGVARVLEAEALRARQGEPLNAPLVAAIVEYLRDYPCRFHHPKEEQFLFPALARHGEAASKAIEALMLQHGAEEKLIARLDGAAKNLRENPQDQDAFAVAAETYARFLEAHVREEETNVFPLAETLLGEDEWARMDDAFAAHNDPLLDSESQHFQQLRRTISTLGLRPFGM